MQYDFIYDGSTTIPLDTDIFTESLLIKAISQLRISCIDFVGYSGEPQYKLQTSLDGITFTDYDGDGATTREVLFDIVKTGVIGLFVRVAIITKGSDSGTCTIRLYGK